MSKKRKRPPSPYTPRPRCWRCHGRRVVIVDDQIRPCPSCNYPDGAPQADPRDEAPAFEAIARRAA